MAVDLRNSPAAEGSFSPAGAAAWNGSPAWSGLTAGQILFPNSATTLTDSANFTFGPAAGQGLFVGAGTATTDVNALSLTQTWNAAGVTFTHEKHVITDTASAAGSLALQYLGGAAGATNLLSLSKAGNIVAGGDITLGSPFVRFASTSIAIQAANAGLVLIDSSGNQSMALSYTVGQITTVSGGFIGFTNSATVGYSGTDTAISRVSPGLIGIGTGAAGSVAGSASMNNCKAVSYTVGSTNGASFGPGLPTSITIVNGIVTAAS